MKIAIHQPNYLPWLGYFNKIFNCDIFVFLDNVQFSKNSYINRVQILSNIGRIWITQPVAIKGHFGCHIKDVKFASLDWYEKHKKTLKQFYGKHLFFNDLLPLMELYDNFRSTNLSETNILFTKTVCNLLQIERDFRIASELPIPPSEEPTERIISIVKHLGGDVYLSGAGGKKYHSEASFYSSKISIEYIHCKDKNYPQLKQSNFEEGLSIVDAISNIGVNGVRKLLSGK